MPDTNLKKLILTYSPGLKKLFLNEIRTLLPESKSQSINGVMEVENVSWKNLAQFVSRSRLASRVLIPIKEFSAWGGEDLYEQCLEIDWDDYLHPKQSFAIYGHGKTEDCDYKLNFGVLKIKDALVDSFRKKNIPRPNVDRNEADLRIEAHFFNGKVSLSVDLLGRPLHRRGYRLEEGPAPLRESRAAALLDFAGYTGKEDLCDPFCGTGTILIEAALQAQNRFPGTLRNWKTKIPLFKEFNEELDELRKVDSINKDINEIKIFGYDRDPDQIKRAEANAKRAGVDHLIKFRVQKAQSLSFQGMIVCNPPYGERMDEKEYAMRLMNQVLDNFKENCHGSTLTWVLPEHVLEATHENLRAQKKLAVPVAKIKSIFAHYEIK